MKVGDEFITLAEVAGIFAQHANVHRIQIERSALHRYVITVMDDQRPNDLKKISRLNKQMDYDRNKKRGWEKLVGYHIPTDSIRFVFYRLSEES